MPEATVDTSSYPTAQPINLLGIASGAQGLANAQQTNQLLRTENQRQNVALSQDQVDYAHKQYDGLGTLITSLAADPAIGTAQGPAMVHTYADNAVKMGFITPQQRDAALQTMPTDPSQLPQWLQTQSLAHMDSQSRFSNTYGTPGTISNGNRIIPVATSPIAGVRRIGADIPMETSPGERNSLVPGKNAQGQDVMIPQGQVVRAGGQNALTGMPMDPGNKLMAPGTSPQSSPTVQPQQGGGAAISPPAGQVAALATQEQAGSEAYARDQQREANYQNDVLPLTKSIEQLQALGTTGSGPGTDTINQWKSFAQSMGIGTIAGIDPDKITSYDEAKKYLTSYASSIGGSGTNDKLAAAFAGNPSTTISNAAAVNVAKTALSMRRMQNAQVRAFSATGQSPGAYNKYAATFNASQDPVAYGFDMMAPPARQKYFQGLSAPEKTKFLSSLNTATQLGVVAPPSATPAPTEASNGG